MPDKLCLRFMRCDLHREALAGMHMLDRLSTPRIPRIRRQPSFQAAGKKCEKLSIVLAVTIDLW